MANEVSVKDRLEIKDSVMKRIVELQMNNELHVPANYHAQNAITAAFLKLSDRSNGESLIDKCTKESVSQALLSMVVQGLDPTKDQCYFIPYGNQLSLSRSYLGTIAMTKRIPGVRDVKAYAVYKNDKFELGFDIATGMQTVVSFSPSIERKENDLVGAFAVILGRDVVLHVEYMTMDEIRRAWKQGASKGESPAHKGFPQEMAKKTVINRACKMFAKTADDAPIAQYLRNEPTTEEIEAEIIGQSEAEITEFTEEIDEQTGEILVPQVDF